MFVHYSIHAHQQRERRRPPQAAASASSSDASTAVPTLPPLRPARRDYGRNDPFLPAWFSEEARHSPPRRFNPNPKSELTEEVDFLRDNHFLPDRSYGDLLTLSATLAQINESARYAKELEQYQELPGLQQFFTAKPHKNRTLTRLTFDFSQLEEEYHDKREQGMVFCAMSELHDRGFVRMRGKYPYIVSITPLGKEALERLEAKPPVYRQQDKLPAKPPVYRQFDNPPEYEFDTQA